MVDHQDQKVLSPGFNEERSIDTMKVETHLDHIEPVNFSINLNAWSPICKGSNLIS